MPMKCTMLLEWTALGWIVPVAGSCRLPDGVIRVRWTSSPRNGPNGPYRLADAGVVIHYRCGSVSPQAGRLPCYPGTSLLLHFLTDGIYTTGKWVAVRNDLGWRLVVA